MDYRTQTKNGYPVVALIDYENANKGKVAVFKQAENLYGWGNFYNVEDGTWAYGHYDYRTVAAAIEGIVSEKHDNIYLKKDPNYYSEEAKEAMDLFNVNVSYRDDQLLDVEIKAYNEKQAQDFATIELEKKFEFFTQKIDVEVREKEIQDLLSQTDLIETNHEFIKSLVDKYIDKEKFTDEERNDFYYKEKDKYIICSNLEGDCYMDEYTPSQFKNELRQRAIIKKYEKKDYSNIKQGAGKEGK